MEHGRRLLTAGIIAGTVLCLAGGMVALAQPPSDDPVLPADLDTPPSEMHPDRWPAPAETKEPKVSPKTETDVLEFLKKHMKYYYDRLMQLKRKDIRAYRKALEYLEGKVKQLRAMPEAIRDAHIRNVNVQVDILRTAKGYHKAKTDKDRNALKATLQKLLSEKFDIEQKVGEYRLKQLDEKLAQRKKKLQERSKDRDKIIAEELRCWLQPPAGTAAKTQPTSKPVEPKKAPASQPATKPAEPKKAPSPKPAPKPVTPKKTPPPTTQPATQPTTAPTTKPT